MVIRGLHERRLYFIGYIGSSQINRIQIDQGSSLSIMPYRVLQFHGISSRKLSATNTVISGFNALNSRPLGKIRLNCRIGDLKMEATYYIIDTDPFYNFL